MKWWRTSTWPSFSSGTCASTSLKLSATASPVGRETRWICWLVLMIDSLSLKAFNSLGGIEQLLGLGAGRQGLDVLEGAGRLRDDRPGFIDDRSLAERHRHGAVHEPAERAQAPDAGSHEGGLHLDRDDAVRLGMAGLVGAARGVRHRDIEQRHRD